MILHFLFPTASQEIHEESKGVELMVIVIIVITVITVGSIPMREPLFKFILILYFIYIKGSIAYWANILINSKPQSCVEILSNSNKSPIEYAFIYEPKLISAFIVKGIATADYANKFYDSVRFSISYTTGTDSSTVQMLNFQSDTISVCYSLILVINYNNL